MIYKPVNGLVKRPESFPKFTRMRDRRLSFGYSQDDLATLSGVSRAVIANMESGHCNPTYWTLYRLAIALDTDIASII